MQAVASIPFKTSILDSDYNPTRMQIADLDKSSRVQLVSIQILDKLQTVEYYEGEGAICQAISLHGTALPIPTDLLYYHTILFPTLGCPSRCQHSFVLLNANFEPTSLGGRPEKANSSGHPHPHLPGTF